MKIHYFTLTMKIPNFEIITGRHRAIFENPENRDFGKNENPENLKFLLIFPWSAPTKLFFVASRATPAPIL